MSSGGESGHMRGFVAVRKWEVNGEWGVERRGHQKFTVCRRDLGGISAFFLVLTTAH